MKQLLLSFAIVLSCSFTLQDDEETRLFVVKGATKVMMKCDCMMAKNPGDYMTYRYLFLQNSKEEYGMFQLSKEGPTIKIPLTEGKDEKRKKGTDWTTTFEDDDYTIIIEATKAPKTNMTAYNYHIDFTMKYGDGKKETYTQKMVGMCKD